MANDSTSSVAPPDAKKVAFWAITIVAVLLVGLRLAIALVGGGELASADSVYLLDAVLLALVLAVSLIVIVRAATNVPWAVLTSRVLASNSDGVVLSSVIETDQFPFLRQNGDPNRLGFLPFNAAVVLRRNSLAVWRRSHGEAQEVAKLQSEDLSVQVTSVSTPLGVFPALEVAVSSESLRLYPMDVSRWWRVQRLNAAQLEALVEDIPKNG
jgi:hypothetical protein